MNKVPRRILTALLIPVCLMCAGCDGSDAEDGDIRSEAVAEESVANCADYDGRMTIGECELRLHDGRRVTCAVLIGYRKGGLSCDWANATKTAEKTE